MDENGSNIDPMEWEDQVSSMEHDAVTSASFGSYIHPDPTSEKGIMKYIDDRRLHEKISISRIHPCIFLYTGEGDQPDIKHAIFLEKDRKSGWVFRDKECRLNSIPSDPRAVAGSDTIENRFLFLIDTLKKIFRSYTTDPFKETEIIRKLLQARACHADVIFSGLSIKLENIKSLLTSGRSGRFEAIVRALASYIYEASESIQFRGTDDNIFLTEPLNATMRGKTYEWRLYDHHICIINLQAVPYFKLANSMDTQFKLCDKNYSWKDVLCPYVPDNQIVSLKLFFSVSLIQGSQDLISAEVCRMIFSPNVVARKPKWEGMMPSQFIFERAIFRVMVGRLRRLTSVLLPLIGNISTGNLQGREAKQELLCSVICEVLNSRHLSVRNVFRCQLRWCEPSAPSYNEQKIRQYLEPLTTYICFDSTDPRVLLFRECLSQSSDSHFKFYFRINNKEHYWNIQNGFCEIFEVPAQSTVNPSTNSALVSLPGGGGSEGFSPSRNGTGMSAGLRFSPGNGPVLKLLSSLDRLLDKTIFF